MLHEEALKKVMFCLKKRIKKTWLLFLNGQRSLMGKKGSP